MSSTCQTFSVSVLIYSIFDGGFHCEAIVPTCYIITKHNKMMLCINYNFMRWCEDGKKYFYIFSIIGGPLFLNNLNIRNMLKASTF